MRLHATMPAWEVVYRGFMAFYGLVFPAYVWICMIPNAGWALGNRGRGGTAGSCGCSAAGGSCWPRPCYWMGFIEHEEAWLVPGLL